MKKLILIAVITLIPTMAFANFTITFENTHDKKLIYFFYWVDHPFESNRPANLATGELDVSKSRRLSSEYVNGKYVVVWTHGSEPLNEMYIDIQDGITRIKITPRVYVFEKDI
jgi:hypothetical protein